MSFEENADPPLERGSEVQGSSETMRAVDGIRLNSRSVERNVASSESSSEGRVDSEVESSAEEEVHAKPSKKHPRARKRAPSKWDPLDVETTPPTQRPVATPMRSSLRKLGLGMWDEPPCAESSMSRSVPLVPKKALELYVGNLAYGQVNGLVIISAFNRLFNFLPDFAKAYPRDTSPVCSVNFPNDSKHGVVNDTFAFVKFIDEVVTNTAYNMSGFQILGRPTHIGRPQSHSRDDEDYALPSLNVSPLQEVGLLPVVPPRPGPRSLQVVKRREIYVGGLAAGIVTIQTVRELLTSICVELAEFEPQKGPPITNITMSPTGTYCFVEVQNNEMATRLIPVLHDTMLCGKKLKVGRPQNWWNGMSDDVNPSTEWEQPGACKEKHTVRVSSAEPVTDASAAFLAGAAAVARLKI